MNEGILAAIGHTPLISLKRAVDDLRFHLFAKVEALNPGGSIKDRTAYNVIDHALRKGLIKRGTTVIESSSGNMGIGLAQVCAYLNLPFICVVDPKTTKQNIHILETYGAQIEYVSEPDEGGEFLQARLRKVEELLQEIENSFWPDQYSNIHNALAHHQTMKEIVTTLNGNVDYLVCPTSTCGTIRGCAEYAQEQKLKTRIWAVDAEGSVIFGHRPAKRLIPGHGASLVPNLCKPDLIHRVIHVSDLDCIIGCRRLVRREALLVGGSSGGAIMAMEKAKRDIPDDVNCVIIFPDRGERYLNTIYSDEWVKENFKESEDLLNV